MEIYKITEISVEDMQKIVNAKPKIEEIKKYIESFGYQLLSDTYKNNQEKLGFRCPKGHSFEMS